MIIKVILETTEKIEGQTTLSPKVNILVDVSLFFSFYVIVNIVLSEQF